MLQVVVFHHASPVCSMVLVIKSFPNLIARVSACTAATECELNSPAKLYTRPSRSHSNLLGGLVKHALYGTRLHTLCSASDVNQRISG